MSWIDRLIEVEDKMVNDAVARERERCARLAEQWADAREPERGGHALRNFAAALREGATAGVAIPAAVDASVPVMRRNWSGGLTASHADGGFSDLEQSARGVAPRGNTPYDEGPFTLAEDSEALVLAVRAHIDGWSSATFGWQGNPDPMIAERNKGAAIQAHAAECLRRIRLTLGVALPLAGQENNDA
jgi:hypothetical protein